MRDHRSTASRRKLLKLVSGAPALAARISAVGSAAVVVSLVVGTAIAVHGQTTLNGKLQTQLERLFPTATEFSPKQQTPPHYKAYATTPSGERTLLGVAFWTTELEPLERGYDGPIKILVGMNMNGVLTGVVVAEHHEPYGYFSIDKKQFAVQFVDKSIRDPFTIGADVDAVSRASISIASATRAIRNSARRVARQLLLPPESSSTAK
jgi:NosR/NirI family nitrous oxide reductase transcriptional regulator